MEWTAVIEADRAFYDSTVAGGPFPIAFPDDLESRQVPLSGEEVLIGRRSEARGIVPGIDLSAPVEDSAVSHRHAVLRRQADGSWALVDEMSTNGTWLNGASQPLERNVLTALDHGDRINVGAFTRITIVRDDESAPPLPPPRP